jgi:cellobiose phosphorylase
MIAGKDAATPGEAKNAWLTGTAAWTFLTISQGFCGIQPDYKGLRIDPCIPKDWPEFSVTRKFRGTTYHIHVSNPDHQNRGIREILVNGEKRQDNLLPVTTDGSEVSVEVTLGTPLSTHRD